VPTRESGSVTARSQSQEADGRQELRSGPLRFVFHPADERLAQALARSALITPLPVLPPDILADSIVTVYLARDEAAFDSLTGGRAPEWGAGVAFPDAGIIVLPAYTSRRGGEIDLAGVLRHEIAHVALQRWLGGLRSPVWFTEGYATWAAGQLDAEAGWLLRLAFVTGRAPPLDSLALGWPAGAIDARVAYLLSASAVEFLHRGGGDRVMRIFMERWRSSGSFETALFEVYGYGLAQFESVWSKDVRRRYGWLRFLAQSTVVWTIIGIIVIALFIIRRRRDRRRLARLRETEPPDRPAYWLGEDQPEATQPGPPEPGPGAASHEQEPEHPGADRQSDPGSHWQSDPAADRQSDPGPDRQSDPGPDRRSDPGQGTDRPQ
jgi:hypothetical protein